MHNYDHEIERPEDRAIHKFLWCDYFTDSTVLSAQMEGDNRKCVVVTLRSDRDERAEWGKFYGDYQKWRAYVEANEQKYIYILKFHDAIYFERSQTGCWMSEFQNARFKKTALLMKLQEKSEKKLYHLRIMTSDGHMELIFSKFEIRKQHGRMDYSRKTVADPPMPDDFTLELAEEEEYTALPPDDYERFLMLRRMYYAENPAALQVARDCLDETSLCEDSKPYAAHILGKIGDETDIPRLMALYFSLEKDLLRIGIDYRTIALHKQTIMDAAELIDYRAKRKSGGI